MAGGRGGFSIASLICAGSHGFLTLPFLPSAAVLRLHLRVSLVSILLMVRVDGLVPQTVGNRSFLWRQSTRTSQYASQWRPKMMS